MEAIKRGIGRIKRAFSVLNERRWTTVSGTLVFFLIMSLVPFTFWLAVLFGSLHLDAGQIFDLELFDWAKDFLVFLLENAEGAKKGVSVLFLLTTLWSCSGFFYHLRRSGEIIYGYERVKKGWRVRLSALVATVVLLFAFAVAAAVLIGSIFATKFLPPFISYPVIYSLVLVVGFFTAWLMNAYVCPYRARPAETVVGSAITALAWLIASVAFSVYLGFGDKERLYGALSTVIVFLLWLYWMMMCFSVGVIYNARRMAVHKLEHKRF